MAPSKRTLLWDWTLTRDYPNTPALHDAVKAIKPGSFASVANWNTWRPTELPGTLRFQPTVRTAAQLEGGDWTNLQASVQAELNRAGGGEVLVLTFNEPERIPLAPQQAAQLWRAKLVPLRHDKGAGRVKLVAPSCASDDAGAKWIAEFMKLVGGDAGAKPDYVGAHFYTAQQAGADQEIQAAKKYLTDLHSKYGHPLVVSEIASTSRNAGDVEKWSHEMAKWMDAQAWVHEYAFFGAMREVADGFVSPQAQLLDKQGHWTKLGKWWLGEA